ncbi:MAG: TetR/AcrR family transcriptional regulator [Lactobacillus sp.]|jgi:AcrR family transcriptional regulator|nr:TetR/AcrR family transcriptional regulator [Lactobacillus sp.]MCI2033386.1 TetR/AcrR family transcriptional regulator [Lactobacillus sp.]
MAKPPLRTEFLTVARQRFAQKGFHATTTRELNAALAASEGSLYYYFPKGKRQLLDEIVAAGATWPAPGAWSLAQVDTPEAVERQLLAGLASWWQAFLRPEVYQTLLIVVRERAELRSAQVAWFQKRRDQMQAQVQQALQTLTGPLRLPLAQAQALAVLIVALYRNCLWETLGLAGQPNGSRDLPAALRPELHLLVQQCWGLT